MAALTLREKKIGFKRNQTREDDNIKLNFENLTIKLILAGLLERERERGGRRKEMICPDILLRSDALLFCKWRMFRSNMMPQSSGWNCAGRGI
jgi:hypothetical protein